MGNKVNPVVAIVVVAIVLVVAGFALFRSAMGSSAGSDKDKGDTVKVATQALMRTGGDTSKMTPDEKEAYQAAMKKGLIQNPNMLPPPGGSNAGGYNPMAGYGGAPRGGAGQ